jgi:hypothetical protein
MSLALCVECQAADVGMFLRFFRFGVLALGRRALRPAIHAEMDSTSGEVRSKFDQHKRVYRYVSGETSYKRTSVPE